MSKEAGYGIFLAACGAISVGIGLNNFNLGWASFCYILVLSGLHKDIINA